MAHPVWLSDANFPITGENRTMHLNIAQGEVANRVLCVGDLGRAERIAEYFDDPANVYKNISKRGFAVYSGTFKGVRVSIIGTGMGVPMTDFVFRECRAMVSGRMAFVRYGTTGLIKAHHPAGTLVCSISSRYVSRNYDYTPGSPASEAYLISKKLSAHGPLMDAVRLRLKETVGEQAVVDGVDLTGETFYDCQGRVDPQFEDYNETLVERLKEVEPDATNFQMETFKMYHLSHISKGSIVTAAVAIGLLNRITNEILTEEQLHEKERQGGRAILQALVDFPLD